MQKSFFLIAVLAIVSLVNTSKCYGTTVADTLYINKGVLVTVDSLSLHSLAFNNSSDFTKNSAVITLTSGDSLLLTIINQDDTPHDFAIKNTAVTTTGIQPGASRTVTVPVLKTGVYIYYDPKEFPKNSYLGLAGMIYVKDNTSDRTFFWNLKEHQPEWNAGFKTDTTVTLSEYDPAYFTINGISNPAIGADSTAIIRGGVGERLLICMANTGLSTHSIHFHGYHLRIIYSSEDQRFVGRIKDTFRVTSMNSYLLELIPDKPGLFPIHDHNLIANTGRLHYPNGMFMMMDIK